MKIFSYHDSFFNKTFTDCYFKVDKYKNNKGMSIQLFGNEEGEDFAEPLAFVTVNIGRLPEGCVAIKSYAENAGILEMLLELQIVICVVDVIQDGYISIPICKIDLANLERYSY